MSDSRDWSSAYVTWKLFETVLEAESKDVKSMRRAEILDLFSDCATAVAGEFITDIEDLDDDLDPDDFDDEDDDEDDFDDDDD